MNDRAFVLVWMWRVWLAVSAGLACFVGHEAARGEWLLAGCWSALAAVWVYDLCRLTREIQRVEQL